MKKLGITSFVVGVLVGQFFLFAASQFPEHAPATALLPEDAPMRPQSSGADLQEEAFEILRTKCNVCHKKQNPFKIFSLKNMDKNAPKIYKQVFILRRMPKGDRSQITDKEYETLQNWLKSKNIF